MKSIIVLSIFIFSLNLNAQNKGNDGSISQDSTVLLYRVLGTKKSKKNLDNKDIYNPINFTEITERMPRANSLKMSHVYNLQSGMDYIKKGSQINLSFDRLFIDNLGNHVNLEVLAYIQRKDRTVKPLSVKGFNEVEDSSNRNVEDIRKRRFPVLGDNMQTLQYNYNIRNIKSSGESYSGEINLAWEEISDDDKIVIQVNNAAKNGVGFTMVLEYDDFGWKQSPTGGFSFVKIARKGFPEFSPAGSIGYSFRYQPRKSANFWNHFFSPGFGPILHIFQNGENTTMGLGAFVTTFYNMVSVGGGYTVNGVNHSKPYVAIGLNFVESYNTLSNLIKR